MSANLKIKFRFFVLFFVFSTSFCFSQNFNSLKGYFIPPVDIPIFLSGNFGELRGNHFHSGIDIKTQGTTGHKVFAVADGYVYRIKIQVEGYGKALYIRHTNGYISVYGHLDKYNDEINSYVLNQQYAKHTHAIELYPPVGKFKVKQGDLIAYSGNTGGSAGPHLHFEIRDKYERPLNPLLMGFPIEDNISPEIKTIAFYPLSGKSCIQGKNDVIFIKPIKNNGVYHLPNNPIEIFGNIGIGVETYDYLNGASNRCGIQLLEIEIDSVQYYEHNMSRFSFSESRFVNSHIDYAEKRKNNKNIQRTFPDPNNPLSIYKNVFNKGVISFDDTLKHSVEINVEDAYKNKSKVSFQLVNHRPSELVVHQKDTIGKLMKYDKQNSFIRNDIEISIPAYSLYNDLNFRYAKLPTELTSYSELHLVHNTYTPVHKQYTLKIKATNVPDKWHSKALIAELDEGKIYNQGGNWENGFVKTTLRNFGSFFVTVDTIAPKINLVFKVGANLQNYSYFKVMVTDDLSGINTYNGYIDDKWVLFEYDPRVNTLQYNMDNNAIEKEKMHTVRIVVTDNTNNGSEVETDFFW